MGACKNLCKERDSPKQPPPLREKNLPHGENGPHKQREKAPTNGKRGPVRRKIAPPPHGEKGLPHIVKKAPLIRTKKPPIWIIFSGRGDERQLLPPPLMAPMVILFSLLCTNADCCPLWF